MSEYLKLHMVGNSTPRRGDYAGVECERYREALSARLDGEEDPAGRAEVSAHLAACAACRRWFDDAAAVTRMVRVASLVAVPDLVVEMPVGKPASVGGRRRRLAAALRGGLGLLGAAQFVLGVAQVAGVPSVGHGHGVAVSTPGHLWHESAAWNVAVGAGFMWIALLRARPAGALPMLTAFLGFLGLVSIQDLVADRVDGVRLFSHGLILVGYLITLALSRPSLDPGRPPADVDRPERRTGTTRLDEADEPATPPRLRLIQGEASVSPTRREAA